MTADGYVPFERLTIVSAEQTLTLSAYRASVDYEFSENCKFAQILVTECKNGTTDECVITMPNLSTNKIWFMKPQGVTTNLSIKFKVIEFGII